MSETKRKTIPLRLRKQVWENTQNPKLSDGFCTVCRTPVHILNFECAHIQSVADGGPTTLENLVVCCNICNRSMGKQNLYEYMETYHPENLKYLKLRKTTAAKSFTSLVRREEQVPSSGTPRQTKTFLQTIVSLFTVTKCSYVFSKGQRKGQKCGASVLAGSNFCSRHR